MEMYLLNYIKNVDLYSIRELNSYSKIKNIISRWTLSPDLNFELKQEMLFTEVFLKKIQPVCLIQAKKQEIIPSNILFNDSLNSLLTLNGKIFLLTKDNLNILIDSIDKRGGDFGIESLKIVNNTFDFKNDSLVLHIDTLA